MNAVDHAVDRKTDADTPVPQPGALYWVQCKGYRCMAVLDANGKWKSFITGEELSGVFNVYSD